MLPTLLCDVLLLLLKSEDVTLLCDVHEPADDVALLCAAVLLLLQLPNAVLLRSADMLGLRSRQRLS